MRSFSSHLTISNHFSGKWILFSEFRIVFFRDKRAKKKELNAEKSESGTYLMTHLFLPAATHLSDLHVIMWPIFYPFLNNIVLSNCSRTYISLTHFLLHETKTFETKKKLLLPFLVCGKWDTRRVATGVFYAFFVSLVILVKVCSHTRKQCM